MSNAYTLLTATQDTISGLALTWGQSATPIPLQISDQPLNRDGIDPQPLPVIWITPTGEGEDIEEAATGNFQDVTYKVEISIVAAGNASFQTNLPAYLALREVICKALARVHYGQVPGFWRVQLKPRDVVTRDLQRDNYDLSILHVHYTVTQLASN